jgi:Family of unknown function (DUF6272)
MDIKIPESNKGFLEFVYGFYKGMKTHEVTLAYEGEINQQIMKAFTNLAQGKMDKEMEAAQVQKRVYHVMVECLQNISKHAFHTDVQPDSELNRGILLIIKNENEYRITTGNVIESKHIDELNETLSQINTLDRIELDKLYKSQLREGELSKKGGAGLGFIDIKRKTGQKLEFHFFPVDTRYSFFLLTSKIPRK